MLIDEFHSTLATVPEWKEPDLRLGLTVDQQAERIDSACERILQRQRAEEAEKVPGRPPAPTPYRVIRKALKAHRRPR